MTTQKQLDANRRNALKSTGPRTRRGKAIVAMNSLRHGLRARTVILPGENRHAFRRLSGYLKAEWQPRSMTEQFYVEQMAVLRWKLMRLEVNENRMCRKTDASESRVALLDRMWELQCRLERSYARVLRKLEFLQAARHKAA